MLIRAGVDILTISRRLGHSKASVTLDTYGHLIEGADAAAAIVEEQAGAAGWAQNGTPPGALYPSTPMVYDMLAIQQMYGANTTTRSGVSPSSMMPAGISHPKG